ncbi:MAG TPA: ribonuclease H-like domain-containing protein, partial [Thermoanaerobaculia bacterium]
VGTPWEEHDPYVREYLIKGKSEAEAEEEKRRGALSPFTGRIVAIGVINADDGRSCALFEVPGQADVAVRREGTRTLISGTEALILKEFWKFLGEKDRFISFNGRQFDGPFLMIRSAINGITPKRDLVGYRYSFHPNCDLREALNFWGSVNSRQYRFNLDLACKTFGIQSSKHEGMDGRAVEGLYREGRYEEIATYCLEDVRATAELYHKLAPTLLCWDSSFRESEARIERSRATREEGAQESLIVPSSEQPFLDSIAEGSELLASSLEDDEDRAPALFDAQPGRVLGKLLDARQEEDDPQPLPELKR